MHVFSNVLRYANEDDYKDNTLMQRVIYVARSYKENLYHATNHPARRRFMETLIENAVRQIDVQIDEQEPLLSHVHMDRGKLLEIECLKAYTFFTVTNSQSHQIVDHRNRSAIKEIWIKLTKEEGYALIPDDMRQEFYIAINTAAKQGTRFKCDLIAALTDSEAITLYQRLTSSWQ